MLVAKLDGDRIEAGIAGRGHEYRCPQCDGLVVLKRGARIIAHFAHKPPTSCSWARGETIAHLKSKALVAAALLQRGLRADVEFILATHSGDRRADVMTWSPKGLQIAFELQHTPIEIEEIERRAASYADAGIAQIWIPFLRPSVWRDGQPTASGWFLERYSPRPFERWVHGLNGKNGMWMYEPNKEEFWLGRMKGHQIHVKESSYYTEDGEEVITGGYDRWSKRYKELTLTGPYNVTDLRLITSSRSAYSSSGYDWPKGRIAKFVPQ